MSRSLARRLTVVAAVGGCLAAATLPALADHGPTHLDSHDVTVTATAQEGTRMFYVLPSTAATPEDMSGVQELDELTFNASGEQEFKVLVRDLNRSLHGGFEVSASMTNLYYDNGDGTYASDIIPSRNLGLKFNSANPLEAVGVRAPVLPKIGVVGALPSCLDPAVQQLLGIDTGLLTGVTGGLTGLLNELTGAQALICEGLGEGLSVDTVVSDDTVVPLPVSATGLNNLLSLPVGLLGGRDSGAFEHPRYGGPVAPAKPAGAPAATTKRVMSGTPLKTDSLLGGLTQTLTTTVGAPSTLLPLDELLEGLAGEYGTLVSGLLQIDATTATTLLSTLDLSLLPVDANSLTSVTGDYIARPVLTANTTAARPGTYKGTLTLDYFDGVQ